MYSIRQAKPKLQRLRNWLLVTQPQQAKFIVYSFKLYWLQSIATLSKVQQDKLSRGLQRMMGFKQGLFSIIDCFNFKGIGLNQLEQYQGESWGLASVLLAMPPKRIDPKKVLADFIIAAKHFLYLRTQLAPAVRKESRWLKGWYKCLEQHRSYSE